MAWPKGKPRKPKQPDPVIDTGSVDGLDRLDALALLKLDAERQADGFGHAFGGWKDQKGDWAEAWCLMCNGKVAVAVHPPPGAPTVNLAPRLLQECC